MGLLLKPEITKCVSLKVVRVGLWSAFTASNNQATLQSISLISCLHVNNELSITHKYMVLAFACMSDKVLFLSQVQSRQ